MSYCAHCGSEVGADAAACATCGKPPRSHTQSTGVAPKSSSKALWLIVIAVVGLVGIAGVGIVAAIFIPNLNDAMQKAKQKRTVGDIRNVGTAWMSWATDEAGARAAGSATVFDFEALEQRLTAAELERQLRGDGSGDAYIYEVPATDGWGHDLEFRQADDLYADPLMAIRSPGRDGRFTGTTYESGTFEALSYDEDIVWVDGFFIRSPEGVGR